MADVLLDSDVVIEWLRGREPFVGQVERLLDRRVELFWTPVSVAEIYAGLRKGEEDVVANLFLVLQCVPVTVDVGRTAGAYLRSYARSHSVELGDALVAACASSEGLQLWTLNRTRYPMTDVELYAPA